MNQQKFRKSVLVSYGASALETEELLAYDQNVFDRSCLKLPVKFPLAPEQPVAAWEEYAIAAKEQGVFQALSSRLVQLQFPIQEGISHTSAYRSATRRGNDRRFTGVRSSHGAPVD